MRVDISLPPHLLAFADREAKRRGTSRPGFLARLLQEEHGRQEVAAYVDRYVWDVADDEEGWRSNQKKQMAEEYGEDEW